MFSITASNQLDVCLPQSPVRAVTDEKLRPITKHKSREVQAQSREVNHKNFFNIAALPASSKKCKIRKLLHAAF